MTTKNQNYIELPVQAEVGTPEEGLVALGFAHGKFQGRDASGHRLYFYPPTYADVAKVNFSVEDLEDENPEWECEISYGEFLFDDSGNLVVQVRDSAENLVFCGVNIDVDGSITLFSAAPFAGSIHVTGVVTRTSGRTRISGLCSGRSRIGTRYNLPYLLSHRPADVYPQCGGTTQPEGDSR